MKKFIIGYYSIADTVTMLGLIFGVLACFVVGQHPVVAMILFALAGLCDSVDGKIARADKTRSKRHRFYGVQLDSLCDAISFGVTPCVMAYRLGYDGAFDLIIYCIFITCGVIRLANFNTEAATETTDLKMDHFTGFPIPTSILVFPFLLLFHILTDGNVAWLFRIVLLFVGIGYISQIRIPKPHTKQQLYIGCGEVAMIIVLLIVSAVK